MRSTGNDYWGIGIIFLKVGNQIEGDTRTNKLIYKN